MFKASLREPIEQLLDQTVTKSIPGYSKGRGHLRIHCFVIAIEELVSLKKLETKCFDLKVLKVRHFEINI